MNKLLIWLGWILTTFAVLAASLAILASINYAMHQTPLPHSNNNMQLETK